MPVDTRLTYDDFCLLPEDGKRREIIEGELFVTPSPQTPHQRAVMRLSVHLWQFVDSHELGEVFGAPFDVVFSEFDVVEPDLLYISNARANVLTNKNVQGAPDLVVEVLSESTARVDRSIKLKLYGKFGVQEYWIIDPNGPSAEIYRRGNEGLALVAKLSAGDALTSPMFPGFSVPLLKLTE
ncbi:MAG: Uma2 family endonuclease [Terriglobia bacterium]|jgi:Uma2 family endonuclease